MNFVPSFLFVVMKERFLADVPTRDIVVQDRLEVTVGVTPTFYSV